MVQIFTLQISWGPLLYDVSRLDNNGLEKSARCISNSCIVMRLLCLVVYDIEIVTLHFKIVWPSKLRSKSMKEISRMLQLYGTNS